MVGHCQAGNLLIPVMNDVRFKLLNIAPFIVVCYDLLEIFLYILDSFLHFECNNHLFNANADDGTRISKTSKEQTFKKN